ncbi:hypothetical protein EVAR_101130_1 [Eumeta japonica]|uniref:Uncharacterized protein n=1 Tax=Eumeta variegata TaxID=151549 RepID=A0A4C2AAF0_EUMVA|nr:hypothetical protein EVAR_101130_1 [Eumeta japonica]
MHCSLHVGLDKRAVTQSSRVVGSSKDGWAYNRDRPAPTRCESHVLVHEFMSIYYAWAGWSSNRERRDERTKRKRGERERRAHQRCDPLKRRRYSRDDDDEDDAAGPAKRRRSV